MNRILQAILNGQDNSSAERPGWFVLKQPTVYVVVRKNVGLGVPSDDWNVRVHYAYVIF